MAETRSPHGNGFKKTAVHEQTDLSHGGKVEVMDVSDLPPFGDGRLKTMTPEQEELYDRQVAESDGFEVGDFGDVVDFMIRPLPVDDELRGRDYYVITMDKVVENYNSNSINATKICDPYILKLNIDIGGGPMLYITFSARDIVDDNAAGDAAEPKVYRAKVLTIFPVHKSVVFFCRFKETLSEWESRTRGKAPSEASC
ncbi:uncharacterized protein LOC116194862 isoform X1 [Punica granatum]|uniref:Uncharacterized protein LOC116194862 isoform X1 n=1 Tax=Punica granatum TaxID=22663 RepID=A0A218WFT8_PUNGR|nr:uncharacterized protein LOC116194862 isoform X1 [Punica granatum]OWM71526.1 hypothetical protein CDL15_Pgr005713 [Punica granatum]